MSAFQILVIDDEIDKGEARKSAYLRLEENQVNGRPVKVRFTKRSDCEGREFASLIAANQFGFVIVDVILKYWGDEANLNTILRGVFATLVTEDAPFALISGSWDQSSLPMVGQLLREFRPRVHPTYISVNDLKQDRVEALCAQMGAHLAHWHPESSYRLSKSEIWLAHISDLHFGSKSTEHTLAGEVNVSLLAQTMCNERGSPPDYLLITGDIAHTGHPVEYEAAHKWLSLLAKALQMELPSDRIMMVPGNHDFSVPMALAQSISVTKQKGVSRKKWRASPDGQLSRSAQLHYRDFWRRVCRGPTRWRIENNGSWFDAGFLDANLLFSGLNTSCDIADDSWPKRQVSDESLAFIGEHAEKCLRKHSLREHMLVHIQLSHHSVFRYANAAEPIGNVQRYVEYESAQRPGIRPMLVFHGHEHSRAPELIGNGRYLVVSGATPSQREQARPQDIARGFTVAKIIRPDNSKVELKLFPYDYSAASPKGYPGWNAPEPISYKYEQEVWSLDANRS